MSAPEQILKSSPTPLLRGTQGEARAGKQQRASTRQPAGAAAPGPSPMQRRSLDAFFEHLIRFFSSLRLTVVCLGLGIILIFAGTLAQVELGLLQAQGERKTRVADLIPAAE